jgi:hypothetical protein
MAEESIKLGEVDSPLTVIIEKYNVVSQRTKAPTEELEAHFLEISLPRLRWIKDVNRLSDEEISLLDKYTIPLPVAARVSQMMSGTLADSFSEEDIAALAKSKQPLQDLWVLENGEKVDEEAMFEVFIAEGYCGLVAKSRESHLGLAEKKSGEDFIRSVNTSVQKRKSASPKQRNAILQFMIQEADKAHLWTSAGLRQKCPKSVEMVEKYIEQNL